MIEQPNSQTDNQPQSPISENPMPRNPSGGKRKVWVAGVVIGVVLLAAGGGVYWWWQAKITKDKKAAMESAQVEMEELQQQVEELQSQLSDREEGEEGTGTPSAVVETEDDYEGWLTYLNDVYSYRIKYPSEASVSEAEKVEFSLSQEDQAAGLTFDDVYNKYTGKICVRVKHGLGYVNFSAAANDEGGSPRVICMRSGVGVCEEEADRTDDAIKNTEVTMEIDGDSYTANRMETNCPGNTIDYTYTETVSIKLDDGTRIEFGGAVGGESGTAKEDYLAIRDDLVKIAESYESI